MIEYDCPSCGHIERVPSEVPNESVCVCLACGWVSIFDQETFRAPSMLEVSLIKHSSDPTFLISIGRGALERQARIMFHNA